MATILVGQFDDFEKTRVAMDELRSLGMPRDDMQAIFFNAPGQHDRFPIGGDEDADAGARGGEAGAAAGAALGGVAGLVVAAAAVPVVGPLAVAAGIGVGAYAGSLAGAVNEMGDGARAGPDVSPRPAGVRLVAHAQTRMDRESILSTFRRHGTLSIEEATGTWRDGAWMDFDPVSVPRWIDMPSAN